MRGVGRGRRGARGSTELALNVRCEAVLWLVGRVHPDRSRLASAASNRNVALPLAFSFSPTQLSLRSLHYTHATPATLDATQDHEELVAFYLRACCVSPSDEMVESQTRKLESCLGRSRSRLAVLAGGIDAELQEALQVLYTKVRRPHLKKYKSIAGTLVPIK